MKKKHTELISFIEKITPTKLTLLLYRKEYQEAKLGSQIRYNF